MFGLSFEKILIIGVIAIFIVGPDRLPVYAGHLARLVRSLREMARGAGERAKEELGPEFSEVDWKKLDPRQYDPRRIIREALMDDEASSPAASVETRVDVSAPERLESEHRPSSRSRENASVTPGSASVRTTETVSAAQRAVRTPFDSEAT